MQKKIVLFTYHNYSSKRYGFFHALADEAQNLGFDICFISFPRPILSILKFGDRFGLKLFKLYYGNKYKNILNISFPSFGIPGIIDVIGSDMYYWLQLQPKFILKYYFKKKIRNAHMIFVESNESVILVDLIKDFKNSNSKLIYRVSDPLLMWGNNYLIENERKLIEISDEVLFTNVKAMHLYSNLNLDYKMRVVSNGFTFPVEKYNDDSKIDVLYLGAASIDWDLLFDCAAKHNNLNFTVITPSNISSKNKLKIKKKNNINFINGVPFKSTYDFINRCKLFIVPYEDKFSKMPLGLTSKYIQAMYYKKPILVYNDSKDLRKFGIHVANDKKEFLALINKLINKNVEYDIDFNDKNWSSIIKNILQKK